MRPASADSAVVLRVGGELIADRPDGFNLARGGDGSIEVQLLKRGNRNFGDSCGSLRLDYAKRNR